MSHGPGCPKCILGTWTCHAALLGLCRIDRPCQLTGTPLVICRITARAGANRPYDVADLYENQPKNRSLEAPAVRSPFSRNSLCMHAQSGPCLILAFSQCCLLICNAL